MSLVSAILFSAPPPVFPGRTQRHVMDNRPAAGSAYCREHSVKIRLANIETIVKAVKAGKQTITDIENLTSISRCTISRALADLEAAGRIRRIRMGKKILFSLTPPKPKDKS